MKLGVSKPDQERGPNEEPLPQVKSEPSLKSDSEVSTTSKCDCSKCIIILLLFFVLAALILVIYVFYTNGFLDNILEPILGPKEDNLIPEVEITPVDESPTVE